MGAVAANLRRIPDCVAALGGALAVLLGALIPQQSGALEYNQYRFLGLPEPYAAQATERVEPIWRAAATVTDAVETTVTGLRRSGWPYTHIYRIEGDRTAQAITVYVSPGTVASTTLYGVSPIQQRWLEKRILETPRGTAITTETLAAMQGRLQTLPWVVGTDGWLQAQRTPGKPATLHTHLDIETEFIETGGAFFLDTLGGGVGLDSTLWNFFHPGIALHGSALARISRIELAQSSPPPTSDVRLRQRIQSVRPIVFGGGHLGFEGRQQSVWNAARRDLGIRYRATDIHAGPTVAWPFADPYGLELQAFYARTGVAAAASAGTGVFHSGGGRLRLGSASSAPYTRIAGFPTEDGAGIEVEGTLTQEQWLRVVGRWAGTWDRFDWFHIAPFADATWIGGARPSLLRAFTLGGVDSMPAFREQHRVGRMGWRTGVRWLPPTGLSGVEPWLGILVGDAYSDTKAIGAPLSELNLGLYVDWQVLRTWIALAAPTRRLEDLRVQFRLALWSE